MPLHALVLTGLGINSEKESKTAVERAGGKAEIVHFNDLVEQPAMLNAYNLLYLPGGFTFADDLGSGKLMANRLRYRLGDHLMDFVRAGKLVLGVCNGFQILAKLGLLPLPDFRQRITLVLNASGKFEDRWVHLKTNPNSPCIFTKGMEQFMLPVRHGEGRLLAADGAEARRMLEQNLHVLQYVDENGRLAGYPYNPNGSIFNIAAICDRSGRILGVMPHPEAFQRPETHPAWTMGNVHEAQGLRFFQNAVRYAEEQGL